ncbi:hypothetical protein ACFS5L_06575 [Streptomyces phyllanthi]|uniref:Uncharacterized protein n=1 Tax=Streptomyces phyllanthi TaxID=1803180 RepID=A0A5N8VZE7_9ACTN|nr:hypothetical protein [Streptomyces phyllanthi]MPY39474.1 hypothetical protein [Streptomyces phyllanthi]
MFHAVLGMGVAVVTASGCVWYVPALADLRAGADRPVSRRITAAACVTGWGTAASFVPLLIVHLAWWALGAVAVVGATATAGLRIRAGAQRRYEAREIARHWAALSDTSPPGHRSHARSRYVFAALTGSGLVAAVVTAAVLLAAGPEDGLDWLLAAVAPAVIVGVFLAVASMYTRAARRDVAGHAGR